MFYRQRKCRGCGEKILKWEAFFDGIARHDIHKRCHKTMEQEYSSTWKFLSDTYVKNGYPPAGDLFHPEVEYIEEWERRMAELKAYKCPEWSVDADHRNQTGISIDWNRVTLTIGDGQTDV